VRLWILVTGLLTSALVFAACGSEERAPVEGDERTMTRTVVVTEADPPDTTRADRRPGGETDAAQDGGSPEDVLALQYRLINAGDYEGAYALFAEQSKQLISPGQYRAFFEANAPYSVTDYSFPSVDVRGDAATVGAEFTVNSSSGREFLQRTQELVREGGVWRVVMRDEQVASFAATGQESAQYEQPASPPPDDDGGGGGAETVTIRVTGDPGVRFSGDIGNIDSTRSVEGTTPAEFEQQVDSGALAFDSVSATMQNAGGAGELRVEMVVGGEVVKESSTTAQYGVVSVNYTPGG
jgi:hypothetical protein